MIPEKQLHSPEEINKILRDNIELSEQVKRLVKTEYALYNTQSELDNQITLYKELYETGKKISITLNVDEIFSHMGNFIINHLNFGGYLLLQRIKSSFCIKYHDGCCSNLIETKSTGECQQARKIFRAIQRPEGDYIVSETTDNPELLNVIRSNFGFDEFVVHAFLIGAEKTPSYLLIVGNPTEKDFFTPILPNTISIIGLGNLVSLMENALNNIIHYQQLLEERKLLEIKVTERTHDLKKAMKDLKKLNNRLNFLSFKDELTGLYNRRGFQIFGEKYFTMAKRKKTDLLILFCDLDKFKSINDLHGHKEGDFALKEAAGILKRAFRDYDIISRFGGDEFVILLDNVSPQGFQPFQERMNNLVIEYNQQSNKSYNILISYGYSAFSPSLNENVTFEDLIEEADKKLYLEKKRKSAQTVLKH